MSNPAVSGVEPSLQSDIAPLLETHGGAGGLVSDKADGLASGLVSDTSASNIAQQADRNLGFENAMKAAAEFKDSVEGEDPVDKQKAKAEKMARAFERMKPQEPDNSDVMVKAIKDIIAAIQKMLKMLFGNKSSENDSPTSGASGYGHDYDEIIEKMTKSMTEFDNDAKDKKKEADLSSDAESGPGGPSGPAAPAKS